MTQDSDPNLLALRGEIEQLVGRCVLQLQRYELATKAILTAHDVSGHMGSPGTGTAPQSSAFKGKTLGRLVRQMRDSFLIDSSNPPPDDPLEDDPAFRFRMQIGFSADDIRQIEGGLKELVAVRNDLVHHFLETNDVRDVTGCQKAKSALEATSRLIKARCDELRQWAADLDQMRQRTVGVIASSEIQQFLVEGIIPWRHTTIAQALQAAATELAIDGWTSVTEASTWVMARHPDEAPHHYDCRTWPQLLQESGLFELRYREAAGKRALWFRDRTQGAGLSVGSERKSN
jgi:hypothetical protein